MDVAFYERRAAAYLEQMARVLRQPRVSGATCAQLFEALLGLTETPPPDPSLAHGFHAPDILRDLAQVLHVPFSKVLRDAIDRAAPRDPRRRRASYMRVRSLSP